MTNEGGAEACAVRIVFQVDSWQLRKPSNPTEHTESETSLVILIDLLQAKLQHIPGVSPLALRRIFKATCTMWRENEAVTISDAVE